MSGSDEIIKNINKVIDEYLPDTLELGINQILAKIQRLAIEKCPVDTGTLRRSITIYSAEAKGKSTEGAIYTDIEYAPFVHAGTYKMEGRPFLKEGADEATKDLDIIWKARL